MVDKKFAKGQVVTVSQLLEGEDGRTETQSTVKIEESGKMQNSQTQTRYEYAEEQRTPLE